MFDRIPNIHQLVNTSYNSDRSYEMPGGREIHAQNVESWQAILPLSVCFCDLRQFYYRQFYYTYYMYIYNFVMDYKKQKSYQLLFLAIFLLNILLCHLSNWKILNYYY